MNLDVIIIMEEDKYDFFPVVIKYIKLIFPCWELIQ